jgi:hypothetical protein
MAGGSTFGTNAGLNTSGQPQFPGKSITTGAPLINPSENTFGANGPYHFGFPDVLVGINFPEANFSLPWYWYIPTQTASLWSFLGPPTWGPGWVWKSIVPVIKILPIDTQPEVPLKPIGYSSLQNAILNGGTPDANFGRFRFTNAFFWKTLGIPKPVFSSPNGVPTTVSGQGMPIAQVITKTIKQWSQTWNSTAASFNKAASGVTANTGDYKIISSGFKVPLPPPNTPVLDAQKLINDGAAFYGPLPETYIFETGQALVTKSGWASPIAIDQLPDQTWDMSVFPPRKVQHGVVGVPESSALSQNYSGYGNTDFPAGSYID